MKHLIIAVQCFAITSAIAFAQSGGELILLPDTCQYFYPIPQPASYVVPEMPLNVLFTYAGIDSTCRSLTYDSLVNVLESFSSPDSAKMLWKNISDAVKYDPLLFERQIRESINSNNGQYRIGMWVFLREAYRRYSELAEPADLAKYIMCGTRFIVEIDVYNVEHIIRPGHLNDVFTGEYGRNDTTKYFCASARSQLVLYGDKIPQNCTQWNYQEDSNCMQISWHTYSASLYPPPGLQDSIIREHENLLESGKRYIVFIGFTPSRNEQTNMMRYSLGPTGCDGKTMVFEVIDGSTVRDPKGIFCESGECDYQLFLQKIEDIIVSLNY